MIKLINLLALISLAILMNSASADVYRSVAKDGTIHYTSTPPGKVKARDVKPKNNSYSRPEASSIRSKIAVINKRKTVPEVVLYSTTWCGYCKRARGYFRQQQIKYKEFDVEKTAKGRKDYKALKGTGVPLILVGKRRVNGFSVDSFNRVYR